MVLQSVLNNSVTTLPDINDKSSLYDEAERRSRDGSQPDNGSDSGMTFATMDAKKAGLMDPELAARGPVCWNVGRQGMQEMNLCGVAG